MTADLEEGAPCTCGCGARLEESDYGAVCNCNCATELKPRTAAQQIHELRAQLEAIDRQLQALSEADVRPAA